MTAFQRLCIVTGVVLFGLIVLGGVVRATDSGLGCPDWPRCHGSFIPKWEKHTLIEYSHRATASAAGLLALSLLVVAWRKYRRVPAITYPATAVMLLILVQAWLGKETVERELPPEIVAVHLTMALTIISVLALLTTTAFAVEGLDAWPKAIHTGAPPQTPGSVNEAVAPPPQMRAAWKAALQASRLDVSPRLGRMAIAASAVTLVLMIAGSYVAGAGYGLACNGWPLCNGEVVPGAHAASVQVHFLHRVLALALGLVLLALLRAAGRERSSAPFAYRLALLAMGIYIAQALVGAANIWTKLAAEVVAVHLGLGALLWLTLAVLNIRVHRLDELLPRSTGAGQRNLVGAPR